MICPTRIGYMRTRSHSSATSSLPKVILCNPNVAVGKEDNVEKSEDVISNFSFKRYLL